jgi:phage terminase Nu1 subunit (DNA packaging protein)
LLQVAKLKCALLFISVLKLNIMLTVVNSSNRTAKSQVVSIPTEVLKELAELKLNTVNSIKTLYASGYTRLQIVDAGFNSSTVYRQVGEYITECKAKATQGDIEMTQE